ncbi:MAG TPA: UDP-N-acetylenolpyruvoylglucosamine reductase, partial [Chitinophagales bacterium]|nr:UDP-N-acetylenolpyruvoylglucosamine reductase [Chitinophagales bacterium]
VKIPAAWLIEQCGFKGKVIGNTGNHAKQSLVVVNYGEATGTEIWEHAQNVIQSVKVKFNIVLSPEVNVL